MNTIRLQRPDGVLVDTLVYTVLHLTDQRGTLRPAVLGRYTFFAHEGAVEFARQTSKTFPAPQRFAVYSPANDYLGSWQLGESLPVFAVAA